MTYRDRREARAERLRGWADGREAKADAAHKTAGEMADAIPFGQPILVGHYSEGRDRRYRDRMVNTMDRAVEHDRKAKAMRSKADNIEAATEHAIYSDDADAIERLEERIAGLEAERTRIKTYNASCRKGAPDLALLDDAQRASYQSVARHSAYSIGKKGEFPGYALTNLSGNINRYRKRLAAMKGA